MPSQTTLHQPWAAALIADGNYAEARLHPFQALADLEDTDDPVATTQFEALARLASRLGQSDLAVRLAAAAGAVRASRDTLVAAASRSLVTRSHFPLSRDLPDRWLVPLHLIPPQLASSGQNL